MKKMSSFTMAEILDSISDDIALELFKNIANNGKKIEEESFSIKNKITRKQYYSRLSKLIKYGLIYREKGIYHLTSFGKVIDYNLRIIEKAYSNLWKLKAIDSLNLSKEISDEERSKIIDSLVDEKIIKDILSLKDTSKENKTEMTQITSQ